MMTRSIEYIRRAFDWTNVFIVAGNITTRSAAFRLAAAGADAVKVGIGGGKVCTTKNVTGVTMPMFSAVRNICESGEVYTKSPTISGWESRSKLSVPVIADGGIRQYGDIAKALAAGASAVMSGWLFAGCSEAPVILDSHGNDVGYRGMASEGAMSRVRDPRTAPVAEGRNQPVCRSKSAITVMTEIKQALQSTLSYVGVSNMNDFRESVEVGVRHSKVYE